MKQIACSTWDLNTRPFGFLRMLSGLMIAKPVAILVTLTGSIVLKPDSAMIDHRPPSVLTLLNLVSCVD